MRKFITAIFITLFVIQISAQQLPINQVTVSLPIIPNATFNILNFGAGISSGDNANAIQKTIDACNAAGGGTVTIPSGVYLCGPISMKSNVNLQLSEGSTLKMLPYGKGNGIEPGTYPNSGKPDFYTHLISGKGLNNIKVSGSGTIEGQGEDWWTAYRVSKAIKRGCLIRFDDCKYIEISGITLQNAPNVHITIGRSSSDVTISNIIIKCPAKSPNTDGIDTWASNIQIFNCNISCGDDNIAMDAGTQNITVKRCTFGTGHGCSVGSYTNGVGNVVVDSCTFSNTTSGIRLKSNRDRGGSEQNFYYSNITMNHVVNPIFISGYYPKTPVTPSDDAAQEVKATTPSWKHIYLKNITISDSPNAGTIWGLPELAVTDVVFDNVKITAETGMKINFANDVVFKNNSEINARSGDAVIAFSSTVSGINFKSGKPN